MAAADASSRAAKSTRSHRIPSNHRASDGGRRDRAERTPPERSASGHRRIAHHCRHWCLSGWIERAQDAARVHRAADGARVRDRRASLARAREPSRDVAPTPLSHAGSAGGRHGGTAGRQRLHHSSQRESEHGRYAPQALEARREASGASSDRSFLSHTRRDARWAIDRRDSHGNWFRRHAGIADHQREGGRHARPISERGSVRLDATLGDRHGRRRSRPPAPGTRLTPGRRRPDAPKGAKIRGRNSALRRSGTHPSEDLRSGARTHRPRLQPVQTLDDHAPG